MHWLDMGRDSGAFCGLDPEAPDFERARPLDFLRNALALHKSGLIAGLLAAPLAVALFLVAAPLQYRAVARLAAPVADGANAGAIRAGEARLIASREFGRRAIKALDIDARPEFDPAATGAGPVGAALVFLGLTPDPARMSRDERILRAYEDRLSVSASESGLDIGFRSRDRAFAAVAANRIAALYLDLRGKTPDAGDPDAPAVVAAMISPAVQPVRPVLPARRLVIEIAAGAAALAIFGFGAMRRSPRRRPEAEAPMEPPRAVGDAQVFARIGDPRRPLSQAGQNAAAKRYAEEDADLLDKVAARNSRRPPGRRRAAHRRRRARAGRRGLRPDADLWRAGSAMRGARFWSASTIATGPTRSPLAARPACAISSKPAPPSPRRSGAIRARGCMSFRPVRAGSPDELPLEPGPIEAHELAGVLDALARTYDFIWLLAPALDADHLARGLAAEADFVVLAAPPQPRGGAIARAEAELREAGARDILVIGAALPPARGFGQDAA